MSKYYQLPSGRILDIEDIMYVGLISEKWTLLGNKHEFQIMWANRETYTFEYSDLYECERDLTFILEILLKMDELHENTLVLS